MMNARRVLVTAVGGNVGQGIVKALRSAGKKYYIVGTDMEALSAGFSMVDSHYRTPRTGALFFRDMLCHIVRSEGIEAVYVCSHAELDFFSVHKRDLEEELGVKIFVNPPDVVRIGSDKYETARFLERAGFPYPDTAAADDKNGVERIIRKCGFPLIVKPRCGFTSKNVFLVESQEMINAASVLVPDLVVQRNIGHPENEFTAATLSGYDRRVCASIVLRRDLNQGTTYRAELVENERITQQIIAVAEALGAVGVCNFQFRLLNGEVFIFEINPRFSGTGGIRYLYGFNEADLIFELLGLGMTVRQPQLRPVVVLRYWNEILIPDTSFEALRTGEVQRGRQITTIKSP